MSETKFVSEMEYLKFKNDFRNCLIMVVAGFVLGAVLGMMMDTNPIIFGIVCAGVPYAWKFIPFLPLGIVALIIKFIIAVILGWIITPIAFVYNFIQLQKYTKQMEEHKDDAINVNVVNQ